MIRPAAFGWNEETAATNTCQNRPREGAAAVQAAARREFMGMVRALRDRGVPVRVVADTLAPARPDAIFPNNWVSFHEEGVVLYPMATPSRRAEVRPEILRRRVALDLRPFAEQGRFLEGTGSLVLDRARRVAFACISPRTDAGLVERFCATMGYTPVLFEADLDGTPPYHTNIVLALVHGVAIFAVPLVTSGRDRVLAALRDYQILPVTARQVREFAANAFGTFGATGPVTVLSERAWNALDPIEQTRFAHTDVVAVPIPTIEAVGGGSARCMLVEVVGAT